MKLKQVSITLFAISACALFLINTMNSSPGSTGFRGLQDAAADPAVAAEPAVAEVPAGEDPILTIEVPSSPAPAFTNIAIAGIDKLLQGLVIAGNLSNSTFDVLTLSSFNQNVTDEGVVYEGQISISNDQNVKVSGAVTGVYDAVNNQFVLTAADDYEVEIEVSEESEEPVEGSEESEESEEPVDGSEESEESEESQESSEESSEESAVVDQLPEGYTRIDLATAQSDAQVQAAFQWGVEALIATGKNQNKIPVGDYTVTGLFSAASRSWRQGKSYKFSANLTGDNYVYVSTNITMFYRYSNSSYKLQGYWYQASNISSDAVYQNATSVEIPTNSTDTTNPTTPTNPTNETNIGGDNSTNPTTPTEPTNNTETGTDNSTNTTVPTEPTNPTVPRNDGYTDLPLTAANDNGVIQNALAAGIQLIIETGLSQNKIPAASANYTLTSLTSVGSKVNGKVGTWYRFIISTKNSLNYKVDANITVFYRNSNSSYKLSYYNYKSYNWPDSALNTNPNNNNNNNNNSNSNTNTSAPVDNNPTTPPANTTVPTDNSGNQTQPTQPAQPSNPANNTAPAANQNSADGFTALTWDQVAQSQQIHGALDFGIYNVIQRGITQKKIPAADPNYVITQNVTASQSVKSNGVWYKFYVHAQNSLKYKADINATVFYRNSNQTYTLNGYSYASSGYPNSALSP